MPPLRERLEDLPILTETILKRLSDQFEKRISIDPAALSLLRNYPWPGNLLELEAVLGRSASLIIGEDPITVDDLPDFVRHPYNLRMESSQFVSIHSLNDIEREALLQSVKVCNGNINKMVQVLGISRTTIWRKLKLYGIPLKDLRQ